MGVIKGIANLACFSLNTALIIYANTLVPIPSTTVSPRNAAVVTANFLNVYDTFYTLYKFYSVVGRVFFVVDWPSVV